MLGRHAWAVHQATFPTAGLHHALVATDCGRGMPHSVASNAERLRPIQSAGVARHDAEQAAAAGRLWLMPPRQAPAAHTGIQCQQACRLMLSLQQAQHMM